MAHKRIEGPKIPCVEGCPICKELDRISKQKKGEKSMNHEEEKIRLKMASMGILMESTPRFPIILSTMHEGHLVTVRYANMTLEEAFEDFTKRELKIIDEPEEEQMTDKIDRVANAIWDDLVNRRGFDSVFQGLDEGVKEEIIEEWTNIIRKNCNPKKDKE